MGSNTSERRAQTDGPGLSGRGIPHLAPDRRLRTVWAALDTDVSGAGYRDRASVLMRLRCQACRGRVASLAIDNARPGSLRRMVRNLEAGQLWMRRTRSCLRQPQQQVTR